MATTLLTLLLTVRIYGAPSLHDADLRDAVAAADETLRAAGLEIRWVQCDLPAAGGPCLEPPAPAHVVLRFMRLPRVRGIHHVTALGDAVLDPKTGAGSLATVYVNRVAELAGLVGVAVGTLLGRAVAHEIGHLLLGTRTHAASGLMRAHWTAQAVRSRDADAWRLSPAEAQAVREAMQARTGNRHAGPSTPAGGQP